MNHPASPAARYERARAQPGFVDDPAQRHAVAALQACHEGLASGQAQGVYLWGPVGRGKTWLMAQFFDSLDVPARRQHFHHFMAWVHRRLFELNGTRDPLQALAVSLSEDIRVLCFDEFFVSDIGDAIILGRLICALLDLGVVLVLTSNQPPDQLYADGFNRLRLLPAIDALQRRLRVIEVDGGQDHRLHPGGARQRYWQGDTAALAEAFEDLRGDSALHSGALAIGTRSLQTLGFTESLLWCEYVHLCERPFAAMDFMLLCDRFQGIFLQGLPCLSAEAQPAKIARGTEDAPAQVLAGDRQLPALSRHDNGVRRFIALVDECYDRRVPLYLEAAVPLERLYPHGHLAFAFRRTLSRLQEMQLARFG
jgi:cell division protein ZapE